LNQQRYVATRPALDSNCRAPLESPQIEQAIALLDARPVPGRMTVEPFGDMEPVRGYVVAQDGALISRRFSDKQLDASQRGVEYQEFSRTAQSQGMPAVATVNSFFSSIKATGYTYTGTYIDVADLGVVATGLTRMALPGFGDTVLAIDVALGTAWVDKLAVEPLRLLPLDLPADGKSAASWAWVVTQAAQHGADDLARLARQCAGLQRAFDTVAACTPNDDPQGGLLAATLIGINSTGPPVARWLIAWMPPLQTSFELAQYLPAVLLVIAGLIYARREQQHRALRSGAATQMRQWTQLVDSMGAALIVIDPNTDRVRFRNAPGQHLGIEVDQVFREHVYADDQRVYDDFNLAAGKSERAYAVRMKSRIDACQWAIIRSTAVAAPLPTLGARESDRLGVMTLLTATEVARLRASLELTEVHEERGKLSSLITHGIAHLTRMLASDGSFDAAIRQWLSTYLMRRVSVLADLLSGWSLPLDEVRRDELAISKLSTQSALETFQRVSLRVAANRELRTGLQWGNGVLSRLPADVLPFRFDLQGWPEDLSLTTRIDGADSFILDELLINAFKHGKPGVPPLLTARVIRGAERRWVEFELRNEVRAVRETRISIAEHRYGGQRLVQEACRRLRWELLPPELQGEVHIVKWRARSIEAAEEYFG
jgi:PAS domain-containing protein